MKKQELPGLSLGRLYNPAADILKLFSFCRTVDVFVHDSGQVLGVQKDVTRLIFSSATG